MLSLTEKLLFVALAFCSLIYTFWGVREVYRVIRRGAPKGHPAPPRWGQIRQRLAAAAVKWATMRPIWQTRTASSVLHGFIAWGFIFYFLVNLGDVLEGFFPVRFMGHGLIGNLYRLLADLFTVAVLVGMVYFLARRFLVRSPALAYRANVKLHPGVTAGAIQRDSLIVGLFILGHVGFRLLGESFVVAQEGGDVFQPFAALLAGAWAGWGEQALTAGRHLGWWGALGLILVFIPYFPYTKHFHLIMSGVNFATKPPRTSLGALEPIDFEDEAIEEFGVARVEDLPWTHLIDAYACIMCNRCQDVCPAYVTGKELSPAALEVNKRLYLNENLETLAAGATSEQTLLGFAISESAVWACTACGACIDICPVGNEPMFDILYMRRREVLMENRFPDQLKTAFRGMERNANPWNQAAGDRLAWAAGLDVPTIDQNPTPEILWWVGCAPAYDPRAQATAKAFATILKHAGVNYAVLGEMEACTGDAARRAGNEYLFYELARANIETLNEVKPPRIVTTCPHCLHTLGREYSQLGGENGLQAMPDIEVIHHSQLLSELTAAGRISVRNNGDADLITFHDPCYLGRHNGIIDAPRAVLGQVTSNTVEMPRHGRQSFCCGAGGAQMWKEEEHGSDGLDQSVNRARLAEAKTTGAQTVAVGCPFCLTMLSDAANQDAGAGTRRARRKVEVKDLAELVAERLE